MEETKVVPNSTQNQVNDGGTGTPTATQSQAQQSSDKTPNTADGNQDGVKGGAEEEKKFSQAEVDKIVADRLKQKESSDMNKVYDKLGIKSDEELESIVKKAQAYDGTKKVLDETSSASQKTSEELAFIKNGIDDKRYDDVRLILKGKGKEVTEENVKSELATHPEWAKQSKQETPNPSPIGAPQVGKTSPDMDEKIQSWLGHKI